MSIPLSRYVSINSGVGAGANVSTRKLIGRFFTTNPLVPTGSFVSFTNANDVGTYFGTSSTEYLRAVMYFGWVSKNISIPPSISFANWAIVATAPLIYGASGPQSLATYTATTAGSFGLTIGGSAQTITALDLSGAASLAAVAALIQSAVRAKTAGGTNFTGATVVYDTINQRFNLVGGTTGPAAITVQAGAGGSDVAGPLGWLSPSTILSAGAAIQSVTDVLTANAGLDNNFGSFAFVPTQTLSQVVEAATWTDAQNNEYLYSVPVAVADAAAWSAALFGISGTTLTLSPITSEFPEQIPMMILAATDYTARNSVQNYMFQENFGVTPSVLTNADANTYDALRINYYGQTQQAGQLIQFYQRGYMMGGTTDALDQNTYTNEIWLKDASAASIMTLLLSLAQIPANKTGRAQILAIVQGIINQAIFNGTISVGKTLTLAQQADITQITGDNTAWQQVSNIGYWVDAVIQSYTGTNSITEYKVVYTLIYSKDDVIRFVQGTDILI